ncbi:tetratricopeptide repeat protein [uncultured Winogradskyella sp.]|uniref:tetratricopeptide repeat protein n=1 Tax=uncultured Winogradskyella sp. TaxID=395353 RepID=UPI003510F728
MKLKNIFTDNKTKVFVVTNQDEEDELNWTIEPTDFDLLPEEENVYYVKAYQVSADGTYDCYLGIMTPERIAETVVKKEPSGQIVAESIYEQEQTIIPAVASDCFGDYELFYAKENPQIGIDVLKDGLTKASNKNIVAEDLGYVLRDEKRIEEAIDAFKISEQTGPSSEYVFLELSRLYREIGQKENELKYKEKFKVSGGIE